MVVYKSKNESWRGFCSPYGIDVQTSSAEEAKEAITNLVKTYEEVLKKYDYPSHLIKNDLSDLEDEKILKLIWPKIVAKISEEVKKNKSLNDYQKFLSKSTEASEMNLNVKGVESVLYSNRQCAPA